jgi:cobalt/nickel transport system permease protein
MSITRIVLPFPMHIPDGFLSVFVSIFFWILSVLIIRIALSETNRNLGERQVPLMGILAAAIFAGQMLNFTVAGGTSGHLLGAALATILLGPWPAILVMTSVVSVQALLFQDGGILAMGANIFNMAIIGVMVSYTVYTLLTHLLRKRSWGHTAAGFTAAWTSIFIASLSGALQLALSGTSPASIVLPTMGAIHALIGIGEGLITTGALAFLFAARKELVKNSNANGDENKGILIGGGLIVLVLAVLSPLASTHPDGLEWVARQAGFLNQAKAALVQIIPNYLMPGIANPALATIAAALLGAVIVFSLAFGVARAEKQSITSENSQR